MTHRIAPTAGTGGNLTSTSDTLRAIEALLEPSQPKARIHDEEGRIDYVGCRLIVARCHAMGLLSYPEPQDSAQ